MRISTDKLTAALPCAVAALAGFPARVRATTWQLDTGDHAGTRRLAARTR